MRHLIWFRRAYERVKLCPIYRKVCNMLRRDMLSELGDSMNDNDEYIYYIDIQKLSQLTISSFQRTYINVKYCIP